MTTIATQDQAVHTGTRHQVIAITDPRLLPELRNALSPHAPLSVVVTKAVTWGRGELQLTYRGKRCTLDRPVARVEVACSDAQVESVVAAIRRVLELDARTASPVSSLTVLAVGARLEAGNADTLGAAGFHEFRSNWGVAAQTS